MTRGKSAVLRVWVAVLVAAASGVAPGSGMPFVGGSLLVAASGQGQAGAQDRGAAAGPWPKCAEMDEMRERASCWHELTNKSGCHVFFPYYGYITSMRMTWSGACAGGVAVGRGAMEWTLSDDSVVEATGTMVRGKQHGTWILRDADGTVEEYSFVDGREAPRAAAGGGYGGPAAGPSPKCAELQNLLVRECWIELTNKPGCHVFGPRYLHALSTPKTWSGACAGGVAVGPGTFGLRWKTFPDTATGTMVRGEKHGRWVERDAFGVYEGPYVDGERHGAWVERYADGAVVQGRLEGRDADIVVDAVKHVAEGPYVDGEKYGRWVARYADGRVEEASYVDGKKHGRWMTRYADGRRETIIYSHGKKSSGKSPR